MQLPFIVKKIIFVDFIYTIDYNDELKLLATGSANNSIKILLFNEEKKMFFEVQHLPNIHSGKFFK